ncbi:MAG: TonB-dependent receptor [Methylococcaceae bacterium]|jgi:vitamin B12 transporter
MKAFLVAPILWVGVSTYTQAENHTSPEGTTLPDVAVTATRSDLPKDELATAATVYNREDIEQLQAKTLPDLLRGTVGLDITQNGGFGQTSSVFLRGTNSDHVLVLIDGIKVGSATLGTSPFELIPLDQIERVEIIRGPQSSLYGSEAIGGVIQIFTRKGSQTEKPRISLDAGGGTYDTARASGTISGQLGKNWYALGLSHFNSQGFNVTRPTPGPFGVNQPDQDGYFNTGLNARVGHRFDNHAEIEAFFLRSEGETKFDGNFQNKLEFINQVVGASGSLDLTKTWHTLLRVGQSLDENDNFAPDNSFASRFNTTRWNASWINQVALAKQHQWVWGSDYRLDEIDSSVQFVERSRYDVGIFTELHSQILDHHFINASLRWDENQAFGDFVTGNFGWRYNSAIGISPFASFGNAFKSPSFNDLYFPNFGNPGLKPEQSTSFEVGLAGNHWLQWEVRAYHTDIDNLITPVLVNPITFDFEALNIGKSQIDGLEFELKKQWQGWNGHLNLSLLNPENRATNLILPRRSQQTLSFDLSKSVGDWDLGTYVLAQGRRFDDAANQIKVNGFVTLDLRAAYHVNKHWTLSGKLANLLDKNYQTVNNFNTAGRNFFVSIHYNN